MNLVESGDAIVGFRPEQFGPATTLTATNAVRLQFRVEVIEYLGAEWILSGSLAGGRFEGKKVIARLASGQSFESGKTYDFAIPERELKFFDRASGTRSSAQALTWQ